MKFVHRGLLIFMDGPKLVITLTACEAYFFPGARMVLDLRQLQHKAAILCLLVLKRLKSYPSVRGIHTLKRVRVEWI